MSISIIFTTVIGCFCLKTKQKLHKCQSVANIQLSFVIGYFSFPHTKHIQGK